MLTSFAILTVADFTGAKLTGTDLTTAKSLYKTKVIPRQILEKIKKEKPNLLKKPS